MKIFKKYWGIFIIIAYVLISIVICVASYIKASKSPNISDLFTILSGLISFLATFGIGIFTLWLTIKIDRTTKREEKRKELEEQKKYIEKLKLIAKPIIYFEKLEEINFSGCIIISENEKVNRLANKNIEGSYKKYAQNLSFELKFKAVNPSMVENIYVSQLTFYIYKDNYSFNRNIKMNFSNFSNNKKSNLKLETDNILITHIDLLFNDETEEEISLKEYIESIKPNACVGFEMEIKSSNTLGVSTTYNAYFKNEILSISNSDFDNKIINSRTLENVMWIEETIIDKDVVNK